MTLKFLTFIEIIKQKKLNEINYTYLNRNALDLFEEDFPNTYLRVGERYIMFLINLLTKYKIESTDNFDFNGFAAQFFENVFENKYSVGVYGGTDEEILFFKKKITEKYKIRVIDYHNGFEDVEFYVNRIKSNKSDIKILGLGNPKQNQALKILSENGIVGIYTCGAFISQQSIKTNRPTYFPVWIFRFVTEKGHFRRTIKSSILSFIIIWKYSKKITKNA